MNTKTPKTYDALDEIVSMEGSVSFGELIRSLRLCDELSQSDLANKIGVSKQHLSAIENGKKVVSPARAVKFAKALGYPSDQFVVAAIEDSLKEAGINLSFDLKKAAGL